MFVERLLRWGTSTAAELAAACNDSAGLRFGSADLAAQHKLLRWGSSTVGDLAAADAARQQEPHSDSQLDQDLPTDDDWTRLRLSELPGRKVCWLRLFKKCKGQQQEQHSELTATGSVRLDQTWPGLEMAQAVNTTLGLNLAALRRKWPSHQGPTRLCSSRASDSEDEATAAAMDSQLGGKQHRQPHKLMRRLSHRHVTKQHLHASPLTEQHTQQQQMQKALQVMTATSIAMLDHATSAALCEQQPHAQ
ncbi:TPA: hypothetical protein ACH3X1_010667 [Trebouxia sp. C0004]